MLSATLPLGRMRTSSSGDIRNDKQALNSSETVAWKSGYAVKSSSCRIGCGFVQASQDDDALTNLLLAVALLRISPIFAVDINVGCSLMHEGASSGDQAVGHRSSVVLCAFGVFASNTFKSAVAVIGRRASIGRTAAG